MPQIHEGLLEKGYWEPAKQESKLTIPARIAKWSGSLVRPAFLTKTGDGPKKLMRTSYLDGLRGFAAFLVYWGHHQLWAHDGLGVEPIFENAWGYENKWYFVAMPGFRTFFSGGHFSVTVFFVISGYVLSNKPLQLIHAGEFGKLCDNVSSALFRRWPRLHLPVICTTFLYMTFFQLFNIRAIPAPERTYRDELWRWYAEIKNFTFVFRTGGDPWFSYNFHSWSIPVEYRGSLVIYTAVLAFSRLSKTARLWGEVGLMVYFMYIADGWFCALFMSGMFLCDLDVLAAKDELPQIFKRLRPFKTPIFYVMLAASIYLGGCPSRSFEVQVLRDSPGWYYLSFLKPQAVFDFKWFYLFWAATFMVASIPNISWLKSFFETRFCQYLGRISFSFYLVHGPVLWILGDRLYAAVGWSRESHAMNIPGWTNRFELPRVGPLGLELNFLLPHLILLPVTLWLAEIVTRLVDEPSVKFSQWLYKKCMAPPSIKL